MLGVIRAFTHERGSAWKSASAAASRGTTGRQDSEAKRKRWVELEASTAVFSSSSSARVISTDPHSGLKDVGSRRARTQGEVTRSGCFAWIQTLTFY